MNNSQTFYQVAPRYTSGSPAQVDEQTALRVARKEVQAHGDLDAGEVDRGLDGIVEVVTDFADGRRVVRDLITAKITEAKPGRIQEVETPSAQALASDLRTVQALINRRGASWLAKWAALASGSEPGIGQAIRINDEGYLDYVQNFPNGPEPRD